MKYTNLTASALIKTGAGKLRGFIVNSHTSGTVKFWDNTSAASTVITNTFTFPAVGVYTFPAEIDFNVGLYCTIGGTADVTLVWD